MEDEKHFIKEFGIKTFTRENYEKLRVQKSRTELEKPVTNDTHEIHAEEDPEEKPQKVLGVDLVCIK